MEPKKIKTSWWDVWFNGHLWECDGVRSYWEHIGDSAARNTDWITPAGVACSAGFSRLKARDDAVRQAAKHTDECNKYMKKNRRKFWGT